MTGVICISAYVFKCRKILRLDKKRYDVHDYILVISLISLSRSCFKYDLVVHLSTINYSMIQISAINYSICKQM